MMLDTTMRAELLSAPLIIKNFVEGDDDCNYEFYLLELINKSKTFSSLGKFKRPPSESNGECDAIIEKYGLDFKLIAGETAPQARNLLSSQITHFANGVTAYSECKARGKSIKATRIFAAFRSKTKEELESIRINPNKAYGMDNDIKSVLRTLETQKNILLFFPYVFSFDVQHTFDEAVASITEGLTNDFHEAFSYRNKKAESFQTYFTCIYDDMFLIYCVKDSVLRFLESVSVSDLPTYVKLKNYDDQFV